MHYYKWSEPRAKAWNFTPRCPSAQQIRSSAHFSIHLAIHRLCVHFLFFFLLCCSWFCTLFSCLLWKPNPNHTCDAKTEWHQICFAHATARLPCQRNSFKLSSLLRFFFHIFHHVFGWIVCVLCSGRMSLRMQSKARNLCALCSKLTTKISLLAPSALVLFERHLFFDLSCWSHRCSSCLGSRFGKLCEKTKRKSQCVVRFNTRTLTHTYTWTHARVQVAKLLNGK